MAFIQQHNAQSPHLTCIRISYLALIPFAILLLWDILAYKVFEVPHLSTIAFPGFVLIFQFITILFAMYGYTVQFVTTGSGITTAKIALLGQYILFGGRSALELYFCYGFRYQEINYIPLPWSIYPKE